MRHVSAVGALVAALAAGCQCAGGGALGDPCSSNSECGPGLFCHPDTFACTASGVGVPGTDAGPPMGTDAVTGTDAIEPPPAVCGNGVHEPGEGCDLGEDNATDADCLPGCITNVCGDGFVDVVGPLAFEQCDPPGVSCTAACRIDPGACAAGAGALTCGAMVIGSNDMAGSTSLVMDYACPMGSGVFNEWGSEVAFTFIAPVDTAVTFDLTDMTADLDLIVLTGAPVCDPSTCIDGHGTGGDEQVVVLANAGQPYYLVVEGFQGATSGFTLSATCPDANSGTEAGGGSGSGGGGGG